MEFTQVFTGVAIVLVMIVAFFGLATTWNAEYGSSLASDAETTSIEGNVTQLLQDNFVDRGLDYAQSTQPQAGAGGEATQQDNLISRAIKSIGLIDDLIGLVPALIKYGAAILGVPSVYWGIAQSLFWIIFSVTLAVLLLLGVKQFL